MKNPRTQFEIKSYSGKNLIDEYHWCVSHLPLKEDRGIVYQVNEIFIITSSERILKKLNEHFKSNFRFGNNIEDRFFFIA